MANLEDDYEATESLALEALEERVTRLETFERSHDDDDSDGTDGDDDDGDLDDEFEDLKARSTHRHAACACVAQHGLCTRRYTCHVLSACIAFPIGCCAALHEQLTSQRRHAFTTDIGLHSPGWHYLQLYSCGMEIKHRTWCLSMWTVGPNSCAA